MTDSIWIYLMIYLGSALMVYNIVRYGLFIKHLKQLGYIKDAIRIVTVLMFLLCMFLVGYLLVGFLGNPDLIMAGILLGGSIFVFLILILLRRITEKIRQTEQLKADLHAAKEASAAKTAFLSNMSHDIRTPLNAIIGYTGLAKKKDVTPEQTLYYVDKIEDSGKHLLVLINDILEMNRIESGKCELEETGTNLYQLMDSVRELFSAQMAEKGLEFSVITEPLRNPAVVCDKTRISRVLLNLVSNAYKFTPSGGQVSVRLCQLPEEKDGRGWYEFRVKDTGIGMQKEFVAKIFEAFERERTSTVSGIQGSGLGMAISKNFTDMMGGTIEVETEPGQGTEMIVRLPLTYCSGESESPCRNLAREEEKADLAGKRLLVTEDMEVNREIAGMILIGNGCLVEFAENGEEAVQKISEQEAGYYDAVLMDIQMPVMDGYQATQRIRALPDPERASVPIVAITANAFQEDVQKALGAGMNDHVAKPVNEKELLSVLGRILQK